MSASLLHTWNEAFVEEALATGAVDAMGDAGVTPLWHAAYFGRADLVARLLQAGARVDAHDADRIARAEGDAHVVSLWHGAPPDPGHPAPTGVISLLHAAVSRDAAGEAAAVVRLLLDHGVPVDARDRYGDTPLHAAAFSSASPEVVRILLDRGADPSAIDRWGRAPLDFCKLDRGIVLAGILLDRGADPNGGPGTAWRPSDAWSIVTNRAYYGDVDFLRLLLDRGADPARHPEALPLAIQQGQEGSLRLLLDHGAPVDGTTEWRFRPRRALACAALQASLPLVEILYPRCKHQADEALATAVEGAWEDAMTGRHADRVKVVRWLLDRGADPSAAIRAAAEIEDPTFARMLLDRGARVDVAGPPGQDSPLVIAVQRDRRETFDLLLAKGADPGPAIFAAAASANDAYVRALIDRGARVDVADAAGETPILHAARSGSHRAARILLAKGADPRARAADGTTAYETAEIAYREGRVGDARVVMSVLADAGGGPARPAPVETKPAGPQKGGRVSHAKFGEGTITAVDGEKLTIAFDGAGTKTLLSKFVALKG